MRATLMTPPRFISQRLVSESLIMNLLLTLAGSFLLAASAQISINLPFTPVPWTLQPLALLLVGAALGSTRGAAATTLYLLEGLSGLPVFAGGAAGAPAFVSFSAGFLLAFPLAAWIAGFAAEQGWGRSILRTILAMTAALVVLYLGGWSWLVAAWGFTPSQAFAAGVAPFVLGDLLKLTIAAIALPSCQHLVERLAARG